MTRLAALVSLLSLPTLAQELAAPPPPPLEAAPPAAVPTVVKDTSVAVQVGFNLGLLAVEVQAGHFYGFGAGNVGIPLVTNGQAGAFAIGLGYTFALSTPSESMWFMDLYGLGNPGWLGGSILMGIGAGIGVRFLHRSGFTLGFKLPIFGAAVSSAGTTTAAAVGLFYLANAIALPVFSLGYRF